MQVTHLEVSEPVTWARRRWASLLETAADPSVQGKGFSHIEAKPLVSEREAWFPPHSVPTGPTAMASSGASLGAGTLPFGTKSQLLGPPASLGC